MDTNKIILNVIDNMNFVEKEQNKEVEEFKNYLLLYALNYDVESYDIMLEDLKDCLLYDLVDNEVKNSLGKNLEQCYNKVVSNILYTTILEDYEHYYNLTYPKNHL